MVSWDNFFLTLTASKLELFSRYSLVVHIFTELMSYLHFSNSQFFFTAQNPELFHAQFSNLL